MEGFWEGFLCFREGFLLVVCQLGGFQVDCRLVQLAASQVECQVGCPVGFQEGWKAACQGCCRVVCRVGCQGT